MLLRNLQSIRHCFYISFENHTNKKNTQVNSAFFLIQRFIRDRDRIRTYDRLLRRQMLYPAELRDLRKNPSKSVTYKGFKRRDWDSNPGNTFALTDQQSAPLPLWHLSYGNLNRTQKYIISRKSTTYLTVQLLRLSKSSFFRSLYLMIANTTNAITNAP